MAAQNRGIVTAAQCRDFGYSPDEIRTRCESGRWRRLCRGVYLVDVELAGEAAVTRANVAAALLALGPGAVAVYETAAELHGLEGVHSSGLIHVSIPPGSARAHRRGIRLHECVLEPDQIVDVDGLRATSAQRTVADLLRRLDRHSAVAAADSALNQGLIASDDLATFERYLRHRRGAARARERLALVDGRAASPLETRVRLICVEGDVAPDELQAPIYDQFGTLLAIADLVWRKHRVIVEADGAGPHEEPQALFRDRRRQNDLVNEGWTVLRFTWADTQRPAYVLSCVRRALSSAVA